MRIVNLGYDFRHPKDFAICRPRGSGDYLLLILRSPAFLQLGDRQLTQGGCVVLFRKGTPQYYGACGQEFVNDWIHFEATREEAAWIESIGLPFEKMLPLFDIMTLTAMVRDLFREHHSESRNAGAIAELSLRILLMKTADLYRDYPGSDPGQYHAQLRQLRTAIYATPQKDWSPETMAESLSISCSYFQHLYKALFQTSVKKDITAARLQYAIYLLSGTRQTVSAIAQQCGYQSDVHFMRVFKSCTGLTPTQYRRQADPAAEKCGYPDNVKLLHETKALTDTQL